MNKIIQGDCLEKLKDLEDNSIDAVVTDPPYGLSFMGKKWDYDVPSQEIWEECLRVLKPGGYLLSFAGTRTQHRMAVRIEDAGFEIRDMIAWVYGSGFPKSLNIGKAVDKLGVNPYGWIEFSKAYKKIVEESKYNHNDIDKHLNIKASSCYWARTDHRGGLPPRHHWEKIKEFIGLDNRYDELYDEVEREILGQKKVMGKDTDLIYGKYKGGTVDVTKGTSEWEGWGTALKPALEPITVARKPLEKGLNVASNCLKWGVGGINIDGCRVEYQGDSDWKNTFRPSENIDRNCWHRDNNKVARKDVINKQGRFPANLIHDGSDEVVGLFPNSKGASSQNNNSNGHIYRGQSLQESKTSLEGYRDWYNDNGSASRFFYCAKASKKERNRGCEELEEKQTVGGGGGIGDYLNDVNSASGKYGSEKAPSKNNHPTVKPLALMEYLVKLVSRDGAVVLDPFAGSGSTLIACKKLNRQYIGIEREPEYIEIINKRLEI